MNIIIRVILFLLAFIPLLLKGNYFLDVWRTSPLDQADRMLWLMIPIVAIICEIVRRKVYTKENPKLCILFALGLLFALAGWGYFSYVNVVNGAAIMSAILVVAFATQLCFGMSVFLSQIPSFIFAMVACPNIGLWMNNYFHLGLDASRSFFIVKFIFVLGFLLIWTVMGLYKKQYPKLSSIIFIFVVCLIAIYGRVSLNKVPVGQSMILDVESMKMGDWLAKRDKVSESDIRFFQGCDDIIRKTYFSPHTSITLLALTVRDVSSLHPVSSCLKSGGFEVITSRQINIEVNSRSVQVNELEVTKYGEKLLMYSWYSNNKNSTGDFTIFRLQPTKSEKWNHYQIMTPISKTPHDAAVLVKNFLEVYDDSESLK